MRKVIFITLSIILIFAMATPTCAAYNYQYVSGADTKETFGLSTHTDEIPRNPELENVRRNKDASLLPPPYGIFSGEIPTEQSSPYHENKRPVSASNVTNYTSDTGFDDNLHTGSSFGDNSSETGGILISTSVMNEPIITQPSYYSDGSIGILKIPKLNQTIKVYEGETLDNMRNGAGHFEFTSNWDGNIGIAGHNRGSAGYFEGVKDLKTGDILTYETKYGKRTYEVYLKEQINDTDYSYLGWTQENILTLITCVNNTPNKRWVVQCHEVK